MTLCKFRPSRSYDAQFIFEQNDVNGLLKMLDGMVAELGEDGMASTPYYTGALIAFKTMFDNAEKNGEVDMWLDFAALFDAALKELEGGGE